MMLRKMPHKSGVNQHHGHFDDIIQLQEMLIISQLFEFIQDFYDI